MQTLARLALHRASRGAAANRFARRHLIGSHAGRCREDLRRWGAGMLGESQDPIMHPQIFTSELVFGKPAQPGRKPDPACGPGSSAAGCAAGCAARCAAGCAAGCAAREKERRPFVLTNCEPSGRSPLPPRHLPLRGNRSRYRDSRVDTYRGMPRRSAASLRSWGWL